MFVYELIGYVGMIFVLVSFIMKGMFWLRFFNMIGGAVCCVYGFLTNTYATAVLNLLLVIINLVYLVIYLVKKRREINGN